MIHRYLGNPVVAWFHVSHVTRRRPPIVRFVSLVSRARHRHNMYYNGHKTENSQGVRRARNKYNV